MVKGSDNVTEQKDKGKVVYIYNREQASYYMSQGIMAKATGVHPKTKRIWYMFGFNETSKVYDQWCLRNR